MHQPAISIVIPNLNRREQLRDTLGRLTSLNELAKQIIVVDNGSTDGADALVEKQFAQVELIRLKQNIGAAARNIGLQRAKAPITLMLDNDSYPAEGTLSRIHEAFRDDRYLGALACRIRLLNERHESGGLPGVFVGCGAAMRTELAQSLGGYPEDFGYYVEEYDLACRVWQSGFQVRWCYDALVYHAKSPTERNMNRILYFLTRNNLRLWHRYSPPECRHAMLKETVRRYGVISRLERARRGYVKGLVAGVRDIMTTYRRRTELTQDQFDAVYGMATVRNKLQAAARSGIRNAAIFGWGKGLEQIIVAANEAGIEPHAIIPDRPLPLKCFKGVALKDDLDPSRQGQTILIGSLSPGVALDMESEAKKRWPTANVIRLIEFA